jgi:UDP-N-acetylglucosamine transferase subunit ALG13
MAASGNAGRSALLGRGAVIFTTIGSVLPFDRLVRAIDNLVHDWPEEEFFAQIGEGKYEPVNMPFKRMLDVGRFGETVRAARLIIAHAGMGSVITAMEANKPLVILPRKAEIREHTTDHQMATARWLTGRPGIYVALDDAELGAAIKSALSADRSGAQELPRFAPEPFLEKIRGYLKGRSKPTR